MSRQKNRVTSQMTLDDDFNVPDSMDDVEQLILQNGEIVIESVRKQERRQSSKENWRFGYYIGHQEDR